MMETKAVFFFCPQGMIMDIETTVLLCSKDGTTYTPPVSSLAQEI